MTEKFQGTENYIATEDLRIAVNAALTQIFRGNIILCALKFFGHKYFLFLAVSAEKPFKGSHMAANIKGKGTVAQPHISCDGCVIAA